MFNHLFIFPHFKIELKRLIKQLGREKHELRGCLKDLEWQLDTEAKVSLRQLNFFIFHMKCKILHFTLFQGYVSSKHCSTENF